MGRTRQDIEATIGGMLFILGGVVTLGGMAAPHASEPDTRGLVLMSLACVAVGVVLVLLPRRLAKHAPPLAVGAAIAICTFGLYLNGERHGGAPIFNELFYFWPVLYVGYFFPPRRTVMVLVAIAVAYFSVLTQYGLTTQAFTPRFTIVVTSLIGTAVALRLLRKRVDGLLRRLNELARTDVLTGLLNRRAFDEALQSEAERANRTEQPFALLLGDVDHFKAINDRHGHAAGDGALARLGHLLTETARSIDTVARVGGEEFALILPGTDRAGGVEAAERLRMALEERPGTVPLTMSFGVVEGPRDGRVPDDLLRAADRALYAAKAAGRDRTVTPDGAPGQAAATAAAVPTGRTAVTAL